MAEQTTEPPRIIRAKEYRTIYTNTFRVRIGDNDVGLIIGYQTQAPNDQMLVQDEAEIVVTPRQLKFMAQMFGRVVEDIESVIGEVVLPEQMKEDIRGIDEVRAAKQAKK